jgi:hypothetical protein
VRSIPVAGPSSVTLARTTVRALVTALVFRLDTLSTGMPVHVLDAGGWNATEVEIDRELLAQLVVAVLEHLSAGGPPGARAYVDFARATVGEGAALRLGFHVRPPGERAEARSIGWAVAAQIAALHRGTLVSEGAGKATLVLPILTRPEGSP